MGISRQSTSRKGDPPLDYLRESCHPFLHWLGSRQRGKRNKRERAIITLAAVVPDLDGFGIIPELLTRQSRHPLLWFSQFHHDLHTLLFAVVVFFTAFFLTGRKWMPAMFAFISFHLHLVEDLVGSRGPDGFRWPIPYLFPFSGAGVVNGRSMLGPTWRSLPHSFL
jgi:inner membrane protein